MSTTATTATATAPAALLPTLPATATQGKRGRVAVPLPAAILAALKAPTATPQALGVWSDTEEGRKERNNLRSKIYSHLKANGVSATLSDYRDTPTSQIYLVIVAK